MATHHEVLSDNGVIQNHIHVNDDELITRDVMPAHHVQSILDLNAATRNDKLYNRKAEGRLAARIPIPTWTEWRREWMNTRRQYCTWQTFLAAKINSRDYSYLRAQDQKIYVPESVRTRG